MGLDMYFYKMKKVKNKTMEELLNIQDKINYGNNESERKKLIKLYNDYLIKQKYEWTKKDYYNFDIEMGYLRKANAIHNYIIKNFANGVDNCEPVVLDKEKLQVLRGKILKIILECKLKKGKIQNGYGFEKNENGELVKKYNYVDGYIMDVTSQKKASKILPTCDGFFFGSTEYNEWYFSDLLETYYIINELLKVNEENYYIYYRASW